MLPSYTVLPYGTKIRFNLYKMRLELFQAHADSTKQSTPLTPLSPKRPAYGVMVIVSPD